MLEVVLVSSPPDPSPAQLLEDGLLVVLVTPLRHGSDLLFRVTEARRLGARASLVPADIAVGVEVALPILSPSGSKTVAVSSRWGTPSCAPSSSDLVRSGRRRA